MDNIAFALTINGEFALFGQVIVQEMLKLLTTTSKYFPKTGFTKKIT